MTASSRILIVDDHASVRDGIRAFLEHKTNFTVCGEAADGLGAIKQAQLLKPDLINFGFSSADSEWNRNSVDS